MSSDNSSSSPRLKNCNSVKNIEVEPEPSPSRVSFIDNENSSNKQEIVRDMNFYKGLFCAILLSEGLSKREGEVLFRKNIENLKKMRELNPDKLFCLVRGRCPDASNRNISDDDIFQYVLGRLEKAKLQGHVFSAVIAFSI